MEQSLNIVFMGTPDFAVPCLQSLAESRHKVCGVFTQPDKPKGRKMILTPPPVKELAQQLGIPVFQPDTLKSDAVYQSILALKPDLIVVVAYGKILPKNILECPRYGCINVHASLLPKYRGAAPIQRAVLNGEAETGVTVMQMDAGLDTGDMLLVRKTDIGENETSEALFDRLSALGARALMDTLEQLDTIVPTPQPAGDFGYASMITKSMSPVDWNQPAHVVHNQIRGLYAWPCATTVIGGQTVKLHQSRLTALIGSKAGTVVKADGRLVVCCGDMRCLEICRLQPQGKKAMDIKAFLAGHTIKEGSRIGE